MSHSGTKYVLGHNFKELPDFSGSRSVCPNV